MSELRAAVREMLEAKSHELFAHYRVSCAVVDEVPSEAHERQLVGVLGFSGGHVTGSVLVAATLTAVAASNPTGEGATRDWAAELTNQLVGRLKNAMLLRGVDVAMSVPVVLGSTRVLSMLSREIAPIHLAVADGFVTLLVEVDGDAPLGEELATDTCAAECDVFLF